MKVSVLIPSYNAACYLPSCLDSVLMQTGIDLTVICCDDGSTDETAAILRAFADHHDNLRFFTQTNAGVSASRNRLLDALSPETEAFSFLDADDTVAPDYYVRLAEALERTKADVAESEYDGPAERVIDDMSVFLLRRTAPGRWINVWNKLYRKSPVEKVRFREGLAFEEDFFYGCEVHAVIRRKVLVPGSYYRYRNNPASVTSRLDLNRYVASACERVRLSAVEFLDAGRVPKKLRQAFCEELTYDAYRMCVRKNLKKNRDAVCRRRLFKEVGDALSKLERETSFRPVGLNPLQRQLYSCCLNGDYRMARLLAVLT